MDVVELKIDLAGDNVTAFGYWEELLTTSIRHYCMNLIFEDV